MSTNEVNDHVPASAAPSGPGNSSGGLNAANFEEFEQKLEELFEKADFQLISKKDYSEAVSYPVFDQF
jgi:hypothetical protein